MASKLLFIDSSVPEREILIENISENVKIVSDSNSLKDIELNNISNIGFIWKNYWIGTVKPRFPDFNYPVERQISNDNELVLERKTIKEIAGNFPELRNIDLITCNLNEDGEWKDAFDELKDGLFVNIDGEDVSVNVRYSIDRTGCATLQGDWISHNVNILDEYFAGNEFVYNHHLDIDPFQTVSNLKTKTSNAFMDNGTTLELTSDITIDVDNYNGIGSKWIACEILDSDGINCIEGNGHRITFDNATLPIESLFFNNTGNELVIKNLIVDGDASNSFKGIVYSENNCPAQQVVVKNCGVKNLQIWVQHGAIFGPYAGYEQNNYVKAIACYSTGDINSGGGIYGYAAGSQGKAYAISCYSTGNISFSSGGIYSSIAGSNNGSAYAIACYSIGVISSNSGGIYGNFAARCQGKAYAIACYSNGIININCGGIYGPTAGDKGSAYAIACYSTGDIISGSGGIYGIRAGQNAKAYAIACYSTGVISILSGGIYGPFTAFNGKVYSIACYSTGGKTGGKDVDSGYIFGTTTGDIDTVETYAIINNNVWKKYNDSMPGSGSGESYVSIGIPEEDLFYYDNMIMPEENQLELRFFRSLPWDPRSPIPQRPFLLDWSTCDFEKVFYDKWFDTNDAWYINNNDFTFDNPITLENVKDLLTNLNNSDLPLDDYEPNDYVDCIKLEPINFCKIQLYDMIYIVKDDEIVRVESIAGHKINGLYTCKDVIYRVNTQFPIYSEFSSVSDNDDFIDQQKCNPFLLNFSCVAEYPFAFANWLDYNDCKNRFNPNFYCCNLKINTFIHNTKLKFKLQFQLKDSKNNNIGEPIITDNNYAIFKNVNLCKEHSVCITDTEKNEIELNEKYIPSKYIYWECC